MRRVSSVLNGDASAYGKQNLLDPSEETCWNSDSGSPQYISLAFSEPTTIRGLSLMFQGGFSGKECYFIAPDHEKIPFHPHDSGALQDFPLDGLAPISKCLILFESSFDLFGR
eukprot:Partr_v1_DN22863_c0_g2_i1_m77504 putative Nuclear receptor 2C2-associated protein